MSTEPEKTSISAQLVKSLRERTGAGFGDCRTALVETKGDLEAAMNVLRKKGQAAAAKKAQRAASQGAIGSYIHAGGRIGVLVEVNCESDFVARTEDFQKLCHDLAMHVAALDPRFVRREEITPDELDRKRAGFREEAIAAGKPPQIVDKIVDGKIEKFCEENCLYEQHFIKDESITIRELIEQMVTKVGAQTGAAASGEADAGEGAEPAPPVLSPK
jgi:elongation factor Ts